MSRLKTIQRAADMRHETVRHRLARARRSGTPLTTEQHLAEHMASFRAGTRAMLEAIGAEFESLKSLELEEQAIGITEGKITPFPIPGSKHRFRHWPKG